MIIQSERSPTENLRYIKFGQWDDLIISQLQAIFQLFLSYPPYPLMRILSSWGIKYSTEVMAALPGGMFI